MILDEPFVPNGFAKNQKGMQSSEMLDPEQNHQALIVWQEATLAMIQYARKFAELGVHKQYANRLTELFSWHTAVITATEFENFEALRINPAAQPEFHEAARVLKQAKDESRPRLLRMGEWHLPYVELDELDGNWPRLVQLSCARAARVSYLTQDGVRDDSKDVELYSRLFSMGHMAPLEHAARPMSGSEYDEARQSEFTLNLDGGLRVHRCRDGDAFRRLCSQFTPPIEILSERVTHFCGNFNGWVQHRKELPGEAIFGSFSQPRRKEE
jgi:hypothetical protein